MVFWVIDRRPHTSFFENYNKLPGQVPPLDSIFGNTQEQQRNSVRANGQVTRRHLRKLLSKRCPLYGRTHVPCRSAFCCISHHLQTHGRENLQHLAA